MNLSMATRWTVRIALALFLRAGFSACDPSVTLPPTPVDAPSGEYATQRSEPAHPAVITPTSAMEPTATSAHAQPLDASLQWIPQDGAIPVTSYSPDGHWMAEMIFSESRYLLQVERTDGSLTWLVADRAGPLSIDTPFPTRFYWSRDGHDLYFYGDTEAGACDIGGANVDPQQLNLENGEITALDPMVELREFSISPDARTFAYLDPDPKANLLTLRDLETGREKQLRFDVPAGMWTVSEMSWAPDGSRMAFTVVAAPCNQTPSHPTSLIVVDLKTGTTRTLIAEEPELDWKFEWVNPEVVLVHALNGASRRIHVEDGSELVGEPVQVLSSEEGEDLGWLSFLASWEGQLAAYAVHADGKDVKRLSGDLTRLFAGLDHPSMEDWSPDGSWIAFTGLPRNGNDSDIYIARLDTLERRNLTDSRAMDGAPDWAPAGDQIVYVSRPPGWDNQPELYLIEMAEDEQAAPLRLTTTQTSDAQPSWSPDGSRIAFVRERGDHGTDLYILNVENASLERLTNNPNGEGGAVWSPDGERIAFLSDVNGIHQVFTINRDGSNLTAVTKEGSGHLSVFHSSPIWSPDGKYIAYISVRDDQRGIYIARADSSGEWLVIEMPVWDHSLYWGIPAGLSEP